MDGRWLFYIFSRYGFFEEQGYVNRSCFREMGYLLEAGDSRDADPLRFAEIPYFGEKIAFSHGF